MTPNAGFLIPTVYKSWLVGLEGRLRELKILSYGIVYSSRLQNMVASEAIFWHTKCRQA